MALDDARGQWTTIADRLNESEVTSAKLSHATDGSCDFCHCCVPFERGSEGASISIADRDQTGDSQGCQKCQKKKS